jgi:dihydroorotate dehydrogenase electron transfer subunit
MTGEIGLPGGLHHRFTVASVREENYRTRTLTMVEPLAAAPGQFAMIWLPGVDERPYSVAGDAPFLLTVAQVGPLSAALCALKPGDHVWARGPLGRGFTLGGRKILLAGGGYGVAPLLFLARRARAAGIEVTACIGARTAADVLLAGAFEAAGAEVRVATEDGALGVKGLIMIALEAAIAAARPDGVYACGPTRMLEAVDRLCEVHGLPRQLSWEAHMRCGIGLCGSCELPDPHEPGAPLNGLPHRAWLACLDGPVSQGASPTTVR